MEEDDAMDEDGQGGDGDEDDSESDDGQPAVTFRYEEDEDIAADNRKKQKEAK